MEILNCNEKPDDSKKNKLNEGMLCHIRLGHAPLSQTDAKIRRKTKRN